MSYVTTTGTPDNDSLTGSAADDLLEGLAGNDTLQGLAGNDRLDGGTGIDTMTGGTGNDIYVVDNAADSIIEDATIIRPLSVGSIQGPGYPFYLPTDTPRLSANGNTLVFRMRVSPTDTTHLDTTQESYYRTPDSFGSLNVTWTNNGSSTFGSSEADVSGDGQWIGFVQWAPMIEADTNEASDIYIRNTANDTFIQVSVTDGEAQANGSSWAPEMTSGGSIVGFLSAATNLVANDTNAKIDAFVRDRTAGTTERVSVSSAGVEANDHSGHLRLSSDGRYAVFDSTATNLVAGDTNSAWDAFLHDRVTHATTLVSSSAAGVQGNGASYSVEISGNGRYAIFNSNATNLVVGDTNNQFDLFRKDLVTGEVQLVSTSATGVLSNNAAFNGTISDDGRYVAFVSFADNLVAGDTNNQPDVFVKDMLTGNIARASMTVSGAEANGMAWSNQVITGTETYLSSAGTPVISGDGSTIAFVSQATNLGVASFNGNMSDVYIVGNPLLQTGGVDTVETSVSYTLPAGVENMTATGSAGITLTGNALNNTLTGNSGNNTLDGSTGIDTLIGGAGDDTYHVDSIFSGGGGGFGYNPSTADTVIEQANEGTDLVISSANEYTLGAHIENLQLTGGAYRGVGNALNNVITADFGQQTLEGAEGDDWLDGGGEGDTLIGGAGNDTYVVDTTYETLTEAPDEGVDSVRSQVTWRLGDHFENLTLLAGLPPVPNASGPIAIGEVHQPIDGHGNALNNVITGNDAANILTGGDGNDTLNGGLGNDTLSGGAGDDVLDGGDGADVFVGGAGNDTFIVDQAGDRVIDAPTLLTWSRVFANAYPVGNSGGPQLSANGRYISFRSAASDLLANDTNYVSDVFVGDLVSGSLQRVSVSTAGAQGDAASGINMRDMADWTSTSAVSNEGRYVAFVSNATNLVADDTNGVADLFMRDTFMGTTTRISTATDGTQGNGQVETVTMSQDGRYVVFTSQASNLVANDTNEATDVFMRDMQTGIVTCLSTNGAGTPVGGFVQGISANGRYVAFNSWNNTLVSGDADIDVDVFVRDLQTGAVTRASLTANGSETEGNNYESQLSVSNDGRYVSFTSWENNLTPNAWYSEHFVYVDAYVKDMQTGAIVQSSASTTGLPTDGVSDHAVMSADGRYVVFQTNSGDRVPNDTNTYSDVFVRDLVTGALQRVSMTDAGLQGYRDSAQATISADGSVIAFYSAANLLSSTGSNYIGYNVYAIDNPLFTGPSVLNGVDTVQASVSYTLDGGIENLTLTGSATNGTGNALNNVLIGNAQANTLQGLAGDDTLTGGQGNDTLRGGDGNDTYLIAAGDGTDTIIESATVASSDTLTLTGITQAQVSLSRVGDDLVITVNAGAQAVPAGAVGIGASAQEIRVQGQFASGVEQAIDLIQFAGGTTLDRAQILAAVGGTVDPNMGTPGPDNLQGTTGGETMTGLGGDDVYTFNHSGDAAVEQPDGGFDTVNASLTITLPANVEVLNLTGSADLAGSGNELTNQINGNSGANWLSGEAGNDTIRGGAGNDDIRGGTGGDLLYGEDGDDVLDGGVGADLMNGGAGNDRYTVSEAGDVIEEAADGGIDTVVANGNYVLYANLENLELLAGATNGSGNSGSNWIVGNAENNWIGGGAGGDTIFGRDGNDAVNGDDGDDVLYGEAGDDVLDGGAGINQLIGGTGNDRYIIRNLGDTIAEDAGAGTDTAEVYVDNYVPFANVENVILAAGILSASGSSADNWMEGNTGNNFLGGGLGHDALFGFAGNDYLKGDDGDDRLEGGEGDDTLEGNAGVDTMVGGDGNDTYYVDGPGDIIVETTTGGVDTVYSTGFYTLSGNIENLVIIGTQAVDGTGDAGGNWMRGNDQANVLNGAGGNDAIYGGDGADTLRGGFGDDVLAGETGGDSYIYEAGDGNDTINENDATAGANDTLTFGGIARSLLAYSRVGDNLVINVNDAVNPGSVTVSNWFAGSQHQIESIVDADGARAAAVISALVTPAPASPAPQAAAGLVWEGLSLSA